MDYVRFGSVVRCSLVPLSSALPLTFGLIARHHDTTAENQLTGSIPTELAGLTAVDYLSLGTCFLVVPSFMVPQSLSLPLTFGGIVPHHETTAANQLTGSIPSEIGGLTRLGSLYIGTCFGVLRCSLVPRSLSLPLTFG